MAEKLPEGTDRIINGAAATRADDDARPVSAGDAAALRAKAQAKASEWTAQAADHARDYAEQGKEKASGALGDVARLIDDSAEQIDDRLGEQYGAYARRASAFVSDAADSLREKDIDELIDDAREFVRRSPAVALAAAAGAGFLAARVVKAGGAATSAPPGGRAKSLPAR